MFAQFEHGGHQFTLTTEHSASSYGMPVLLMDKELTDDFHISSADASQGRRRWRVSTWDGQVVFETWSNRHVDEEVVE